MGKAGEALKQTLEGHGITQNELATALGVGRHVVFRWYHSQVDPTAETVIEIVNALSKINPSASRDFASSYLGDWIASSDAPQEVPQTYELPTSKDLNTSLLAGLFANKTTSYKYIFFISLLHILEKRKFEAVSPISFREIFVEMLAKAWYPYTYFKLSFGSSDRFSKALKRINSDLELTRLNVTGELLRERIDSQNLKEVISWLKRCVPFRLLSPFLEEELKGVNRGRGNELEYAMPEIANKFFKDRCPLYCFNSDSFRYCDSIIVHPAWVKYFQENHAVVEGWAFWNWLLYMQQQNPNVPNVVNKLRMLPIDRGSMEKQKKYWKLVLESQPISCIYSKQPVDVSEMSLDHYVPWSYVTHNQTWNLIPVIPKANSSKSNSIPSKQYFDDFVRVQSVGLTVALKSSETYCKECIDHFVSDLNLEIDDLLDFDKLRSAYVAIIPPLLTLASNKGFPPEWIYKA